MNPTVSLTLPTGNQAKVENARALILLCQDREDDYVVAWGPRNELQKLMIWGSRNWWVLIPPGEGYFQAVAEVEARIVENDATPLVIVSPSCEIKSRATGAVTCTVNLPGRTIRLQGINDVLLFALDEQGVKVRAGSGSGIQKHFLIEKGIATMFGREALAKFAQTTLSGAPTGVRPLLEGMRDQMRKQPDAEIVVSPATADALSKGKGKMEKLRQRIEQAGAWGVMADIELKAFWKYCIEAIGEPLLRETVIRFLEEAVPIHFFLEAAGGSHHPAWQNVRYGMLRNTTECCILLPTMAQYEPALLDEEKRPIPLFVDIALAATVVSDTFKFDAEGKKTGPDHGRVAGKAWREFAVPLGLLSPVIIEQVGTASDWHYGVYTPGYREASNLTAVAWLVHRLDAFFAQKALEKLYHPKGAIE